jgi:hypothetical protein
MAHERLLVSEEDRLLADRDGPVTATDGDSTHGRRGRRSERRLGLFRCVGTLVERLLAGRQLHGKREARRASALLAVRVGEKLEDLQPCQAHQVSSG